MKVTSDEFHAALNSVRKWVKQEQASKHDPMHKVTTYFTGGRQIGTVTQDSMDVSYSLTREFAPVKK